MGVESISLYRFTCNDICGDCEDKSDPLPGHDLDEAAAVARDQGWNVDIDLTVEFLPRVTSLCPLHAGDLTARMKELAKGSPHAPRIPHDGTARPDWMEPSTSAGGGPEIWDVNV